MRILGYSIHEISAQKLITSTLVGVLVLMCLFPPQIDTEYQRRDGREVMLWEDLTYRFIGSGPDQSLTTSIYTRSRIAYGRLALQLFAVTLMGIGGIYLTQREEGGE